MTRQDLIKQIFQLLEELVPFNQVLAYSSWGRWDMIHRDKQTGLGLCWSEVPFHGHFKQHSVL